MATPRFAWGIDVGNRALKAIRLSRDGDRLRVDDMDVIDHEQILSTAGDNKESIVQTSLANFVGRHQVKGGVVGIGVSGQSSFARFIKLPPVEPNKIPEIVRFEAIQQIPFPLEEVEWSYQLFQDAESPDVEVGIFAMRRELVNAIMKNYTDMDMNVQVVQMNPLAVYNAMYYDQRIDGTTMIVDIGAENTDLIIADGETVWLRNISVGGNAFTEALSKQFKLNFVKAEELKRNAATSKYARQILQTLRPVFDDLVSEIQRSIGFYASIHRDSRIKKVLAMGSTFRLPQLQKYVQNKLQLDVARIDGFTSGAPEDGKLATLMNENLMSMGSAYGLAVQAMGSAKIESSLLPEAIRRAKIWKEKTKWFAGAAVLFLAGTAAVAGSWYFNQQEYDAPKSANARDLVDGAIRDGTALDLEWTSVQNFGTNDSQRINNFKTLARYRDVWPRLILDLNKAQGQFSGDPNQIVKLQPDRSKRTEISITNLLSRYEPNIIPLITKSDEEFNSLADSPENGSRPVGGAPRFEPVAGDPNAMPDPNAPAPARGFIVTVVCSSPNAGGANFINQSFVQKLKAITEQQAGERPYYIGKVTIALARKIKDDKTMMTILDARTQAALQLQEAAASEKAAAADATAAGQGRPGTFGRGLPRRAFTPNAQKVELSGPAATQPSINAYLDPRFVFPLPPEDIREDFQFTIVIGVVLDPGMNPPAPGAPQVADAQAH